MTRIATVRRFGIEEAREGKNAFLDKRPGFARYRKVRWVGQNREAHTD
jgi:1,4-dihydroxy-2-naphthoyl-CoA synthase